MSRLRYAEPDSVADELRMWAFEANMWRALKGKKGQAFLRELLVALLALPGKRLIEGDFMRDGEVCAIAAYDLYKRAQQSSIAAALAEMEADYCGGADRGGDVPAALYGQDETVEIAQSYGWVAPFAWAVLQANEDDLGYFSDSPEERYERVLKWVQKSIKD